jgi:hypothetical protein
MPAMVTDTHPDADLSDRFAAIIDRIGVDPGVPDGDAEAVMFETLRFVRLAASTDEPVAPSRLVDVGWHHFILFTREYTAFCAELGGYVHHVPDRPDGGTDPSAYERTRRLLTRRHGRLDERLWPAAGADCGDCEAGKCEAGKCTSSCKS